MAFLVSRSKITVRLFKVLRRMHYKCNNIGNMVEHIKSFKEKKEKVN